jgi:hypothetical protein
MTMKRRHLTELLRIVMATAPDEIDCDAFLDRVATYLEALGPDGEIPPDLQVVSQHLEVCSECKEEFDALLKLHRGGE